MVTLRGHNYNYMAGDVEILRVHALGFACLYLGIMNLCSLLLLQLFWLLKLEVYTCNAMKCFIGRFFTLVTGSPAFVYICICACS